MLPQVLHGQVRHEVSPPHQTVAPVTVVVAGAVVLLLLTLESTSAAAVTLASPHGGSGWLHRCQGLLGAVGRGLHEVPAGVDGVDQLLGLGELDHGALHVGDGTLHQQLVVLVVVEQVVPQRLL